MPFKIVYLMFIFLIFSGMKLILHDGNFIEVNNFELKQEKIIFKKGSRYFNLPAAMVDMKSTNKLKELESNRISIFNLNTSVLVGKENDKSYFLKDKRQDKISIKNDFKIKLETRKESNPFFLEQPNPEQQDEDLLEKIKKKGLILKIEVPIKK